MSRSQQVQLTNLSFESLITLGLLYLSLERSELSLQFGNNVPNPLQILACRCHATLCGLLTLLELRNASDFFDQATTIFRSRVNNESNTSLLNDGIGAGTDAGSEKKVGDITKSHLDIIDEILTGPVAVKPTGNRDFTVSCILRRYITTFGIEGQRHFGHSKWTAAVRARKNNILHGPPTQVLGAHFAHAPTDRVDDITFATAIRTDHARDPLTKVNPRWVSKRFKAVNFEPFNAQGRIPLLLM